VIQYSNCFNLYLLAIDNGVIIHMNYKEFMQEIIMLID
jgi:hypothetical protein